MSGDFWRKTWRIAAKQYACDGCGWTIRQGEIYMDGAAKIDGNFSAYRYCWNCGKASEIIRLVQVPA